MWQLHVVCVDLHALRVDDCDHSQRDQVVELYSAVSGVAVGGCVGHHFGVLQNCHVGNGLTRVISAQVFKPVCSKSAQ